MLGLHVVACARACGGERILRWEACCSSNVILLSAHAGRFWVATVTCQAAVSHTNGSTQSQLQHLSVSPILSVPSLAGAMQSDTDTYLHVQAEDPRAAVHLLSGSHGLHG